MRREPRQEGVEHGRAQHLPASARGARSEEHTSELQSPCNLVCRLLLEKKKTYVFRVLRMLRAIHLFVTTSRAVRNVASGLLEEVVTVSSDITVCTQADYQPAYTAYRAT